MEGLLGQARDIAVIGLLRLLLVDLAAGRTFVVSSGSRSDVAPPPDADGGAEFT